MRKSDGAMTCRISELYRETEDPAVKWVCHSLDGKLLGYKSGPAGDVPPPASSGHDDDDSDDGNVAAWMSGLGL